MKAENLAKILKNYTSGWVSISKNYKKVIASGRTLRVLLQKLEKMGNPDGYLMRAAKDYSGYVGV
ncbi:hypothetical protein CO054_02735 [Candidatus Shapirobacteria bacterium CG_4_9_14_0_2_um_filter_39_11]|uniref:DUF5678 domain-containing protein n=1 Tax=Candidatus Shapirobacteria bacterium CG_4_9_14_0_2_um_filter_39_11 TaxID=1974478 RepID=A0A2M8ESB8_9BACT|nr:MAG: hypothetical protein CO054_02735 [Candidatus Shapirobacteria bacterium CG_4_9_14_0_2_um_filter_39_11]